MQEQSKKSKTEKSPSDYEISIIKALLELKKSDKSISNQKILGYINYRRGNAENHINIGRITETKNGTRGADILPVSEKEAREFIEQYASPTQNDRELDEILKVDANNPDFLITRENDRIEFKASFQGYKDEAFLKFVQGAANNKGGYILFGIGEDDKIHKGKVVGLEEKRIKAFWRDIKEITEQFHSQFGQEIKFERHQREINNKIICILQIFESENKPIIHKNGDIYYRYPGATKKIQKQDLQRIMREQMSKDITLTLSKHIEQILKNGIENSAILNITTGDVEGKSGSFVIDESLLPKIAFIKEGEFVKTKGAPALILKGEVKPYNAWVKEKELFVPDENDI